MFWRGGLAGDRYARIEDGFYGCFSLKNQHMRRSANTLMLEKKIRDEF